MASSTPRLSADSLSPISPPPSRNEYPFPRSVPRVPVWKDGRDADGGRPGSSGRYQPRRESTASSIHSIGGSLDTSTHWHGLNESGQNGKSLDFKPIFFR